MLAAAAIRRVATPRKRCSTAIGPGRSRRTRDATRYNRCSASSTRYRARRTLRRRRIEASATQATRRPPARAARLQTKRRRIRGRAAAISVRLKVNELQKPSFFCVCRVLCCVQLVQFITKIHVFFLCAPSISCAPFSADSFQSTSHGEQHRATGSQLNVGSGGGGETSSLLQQRHLRDEGMTRSVLSTKNAFYLRARARARRQQALQPV